MHFNRFEDENLVKKWCSKLLPPTTKIMFSFVCVLSVYRGSHVTIVMMHWASPYSRLLVTSGGQDRRPVQICSLEDNPPLTGADIWWLLKHIWSSGGRYASYWNAFFILLFKHYFHNNVQSFWSHGAWFI